MFKFWNLHQILSIFKKNMRVIATFFRKLETAKDFFRPISKKHSFGTPFDSQQVKGSQSLVKSAESTFIIFLHHCERHWFAKIDNEQPLKYAWVTEDVRNQVANCHSEFTGFKIKDTVFVIYLKIENCNETKDHEFSDLKARSNEEWSISRRKWQDYATSEFRRYSHRLVQIISQQVTRCFYVYSLNSMYVNFNNELRGYLCVRKEVANLCSPFKDFKEKNNLRLTYLKVKNDV